MELPEPVRALLGASIEPLTGYGASRVYRGNGLVAKVGPGAAAERHVLTRLAPLPIETPESVADGEGWIVMAEVADTADRIWPLPELVELLDDLAALHDSHQAHPALTGPLAVSLVEYFERLAGYGDATGLPERLRAALAAPQHLIALLEAEPVTLVHGDPYPRNILRPAAGRRVWIDWEDSLAGPAALDVAAWAMEGPWGSGSSIYGPAALDHYLARRRAPVERRRFSLAVDAASILLTPSQNLTELADSRGSGAVAAFVADRLAALDRLADNGFSR
ncbi:phosphotransferase family enzyme [Stackebrandtia endophytica]|uniref:Phosphotransferase family enzyme n=1 Tax=Stackebrandtia endophytica TaxID=1496996 RepID=A0A543AUH0_9ACTN|nr:phosphotransferase [Stackebrandtia endophytica]TQL76226.1 phosphotransferase family enzyme [Stackebrandtia endophytica]